MEMLKNKVAVIFAASGQIAGAVARSFAQHGAKVYVTPRNLKEVINLADEIKAAGSQAEAGIVDALNENEIDSYLQNVTLEHVAETAAFLAPENGIIFNSHIIDVDCGKLNVL
jgi:3-oxoacyl-[acyl-carrier protein] reductase